MDFERIKNLHQQLQGEYKRYEHRFVELPPVVVLKEYRYALRALIELEALEQNGCTDEIKLNQAEHKVIHALLCAYHDLLDSAHVQLYELFDTLRKDYPQGFFEAMSDDEKRKEAALLLERVSEEVICSREQLESRPEIYEALFAEYFGKLLELKFEVENHYLPEAIRLQLVYDEQQKSEKERERRLELTTRKSQKIALIASLAAVGSFAVAGFALYDNGNTGCDAEPSIKAGTASKTLMPPSSQPVVRPAKELSP